jgi:predicted DNA-binding protein
MDMSATSIQVSLPAEQLRRLSARARTEGRTLPDVIREAIDAYLAGEPNRQAALDATFGALPDLEVPGREEWAGRASLTG